jgi:F0F1-type ATP synthase membrane subunit b/b'
MYEEPKEKIVVKKGDVTMTIRPSTEEGELLTKTLYDIQETGLPSNQELDTFGDKIWELMEESKQHTTDHKSAKIVETTQKVVDDIKQAVDEKNYDEKLQEITKKLKDETVPETEKGVSTAVKDIEDEGEKIKKTLRETVPLLTDFTRKIMKDSEFRELLLTILDMTQNSYERAEHMNTSPPPLEALKEDIKDTSQTTPENTKEAFKERIKNMRKYMYLADSEQDILISKFSQALMKLRQHREYGTLFENVFKLYDNMIEIWSKIQNEPEFKKAYKENSLMDDIKILIERTSNRPLSRFIELVHQLYDLREDENYLKLRNDIMEVIFDKNKKFEKEEDIKTIYRDIKHQLHELNEKYQDLFDELNWEIRQIIEGITNDPYINKIQSDLTTLFSEIFTDSMGKPTANAAADSLLKIKDIFFPLIKERLELVTLPVIDIESDRYFFRLSNFKLNIPSLIPDNLHIASESYVHVNVEKMKREGTLLFRMLLEPLNTDIENLRFIMSKKRGIKYNDYGTTDIHVRDASIQFNFRLRLEADNVDHVELQDVFVNLRGLKVRILESRHDVLDKIATTLFLPVLRSNLRKLIESRLHELINTEICDRINVGIKNIDKQGIAKMVFKS